MNGQQSVPGVGCTSGVLPGASGGVSPAFQDLVTSALQWGHPHHLSYLSSSQAIKHLEESVPAAGSAPRTQGHQGSGDFPVKLRADRHSGGQKTPLFPPTNCLAMVHTDKNVHFS